MCMAALIIMMLLFTAHVVGRYVFNAPILGTPEVGGYLLGIVTFLGLAYTLRSGAHIRIDVVTTRLPQRAKQVLEVITSFISFYVVVVFVYVGVNLVLDSYRLHAIGWAALKLPLFIPQILLPLGLCVLGLELFVHIFKLFNQKRS